MEPECADWFCGLLGMLDSLEGSRKKLWRNTRRRRYILLDPGFGAIVTGCLWIAGSRVWVL